MKQIPLKILTTGNPQETLDYRQMIELIAKSPEMGRDGRSMGLTIEGVRQGMRILEALEKATETLTLEDADYNNLIRKAKEFKWSMATQSIITFMDDLEKAQDFKEEVTK